MEHPLEAQEAHCYNHQHLQAEGLHASWALEKERDEKKEVNVQQ